MILLHKINPKKLFFPPVEEAFEDGLLAFGGDLSPERLLLAYKSGIFPWYNSDEPILWWSPNPRFVLFPEKLKVSDSMRSVLKKNTFQVTYNQAFEKVVEACATVARNDQEGTWIVNDVKQAYLTLHELKIAMSIEVWQNDSLVGGLYGLKIGNCFFGESMFSHVSNASKAGFITFIKNNPDLKLIDCQVYTNHLESLGAEMIPRQEFLRLINLYM